jgi:hypothetical protein
MPTPRPRMLVLRIAARPVNLAINVTIVDLLESETAVPTPTNVHLELIIPFQSILFLSTYGSHRR